MEIKARDRSKLPARSATADRAQNDAVYQNPMLFRQGTESARGDLPQR